MTSIAGEMIAADIHKLIARIALYDDAAAYKELFLLYHQKLVSFSSSITHSKESAEEVVSDVFFKIWTKRTSLTRIENFHLYIYIITKNLSINALVKQKREKTFSIDDAQVEFRSFSLDPEQIMITAEMLNKIKTAIEELPPKCQMIFKLVKEDGFKIKEVAELFNLSAKTVENQMTIALRKIGGSIQFKLYKISS